jgi:hypothetical protein
MKGFVEPRRVVLSDKALVREPSRIRPAPNQFTHALVRREPYFFVGTGRRAAEPDGYFSRGTKVVLLGRGGGRYCRVADRRGLHVEVRCESLRKSG